MKITLFSQAFNNRYKMDFDEQPAELQKIYMDGWTDGLNQAKRQMDFLLYELEYHNPMKELDDDDL